jgi:outer membrane protein
MKVIKRLIFILIFFNFSNYSYADSTYFVDFKFVLNQSNAGKGAQKFLKNKLDKGIKNLQAKEKQIQDEEKKIIDQKKVISAEDYKKRVTDLRLKVSNLQKERNNLITEVGKQRAKAREELLKNLNPIIKEYMEKNKIRMVIDKKSILLADDTLDITKEIVKELNNKLKSIKLN